MKNASSSEPEDLPTLLETQTEVPSRKNRDTSESFIDVTQPTDPPIEDSEETSPTKKIKTEHSEDGESTVGAEAIDKGWEDLGEERAAEETGIKPAGYADYAATRDVATPEEIDIHVKKEATTLTEADATTEDDIVVVMPQKEHQQKPIAETEKKGKAHVKFDAETGLVTEYVPNPKAVNRLGGDW